jgi:HlyD family secretion protein
MMTTHLLKSEGRGRRPKAESPKSERKPKAEIRIGPTAAQEKFEWHRGQASWFGLRASDFFRFSRLRISDLTILAMAFMSLLAAGCSPAPSNQFQGYIEGDYVYVAAPLGGALTNLAVARGDSVKAGQLLFALERQSEAAALAQAGQDLAQARAQLDDLNKGKRPTEIESMAAQLERMRADSRLSAAELVRREQLGGSDVISKEELDQARAQREADQAQVSQLAADLATAKLGGRDDAIRAAQAAVESQQAAVEKAKWSFDQKQQFAPAAAAVHDTLYRQGEFVAAGNPVVALLPPENLKVRFFVPQQALPRIKTGEAVSVLPDGAAHPLSATVNYISTQAEYTPPVIFSRETRANLVFMIEAKFSPADAADLRPGQPVDVELK